MQDTMTDRQEVDTMTDRQEESKTVHPGVHGGIHFPTESLASGVEGWGEQGTSRAGSRHPTNALVTSTC